MAQPSAVQSSGEAMAQSLSDRGFIPHASATIQKFRVVVAASASDDKLVCEPNYSGALLGGRAFVGICQADRTVDAAGADKNGISVAVAGIARAILKTNTACTKGDEVGYDPAQNGYVEPVTASNRGKVVVIGRFDQSKTTSADLQLVSVVLLTAQRGGGGAVGAIVADSSDVTNDLAETIFSNGSISIPANRLGVGSRIDVKARVSVTSGNGADTLTLKAYVGSVAVGNLIGATPALDVVDLGGDIGLLDLEAVVRSIGATGTLISAGIGAITASVKATGSASTVTVDTTAALPILITATWSAANVANSCKLVQFSVEVKD